MQQMSPTELQARLAGSDAPPPLILDVREPWEVNICALPQATHIPMAQIPARIEELARDREIVVMCHHGVRSQHVAYFLASQGFAKLYNLRGGIDAWAKEVEPGMPKY